MNGKHTINVRRKPDGSLWQVLDDGSMKELKKQMNWSRFDAMTDDEIDVQVEANPDDFASTDDDLARALRVPNPIAIREKLGMSIEEFAETFRLNPWQLRRWESSEEIPDWEAQLLLRVIDLHPEAVIDALQQYTPHIEHHVEKNSTKNESPRELNPPDPEARRYRSAG